MGLTHCSGFIPRASLVIGTGQPVMRPGSSVTLHIENEDGLQGWQCFVYKGGHMYRIQLRRSNDTVPRHFTPGRVVERENIFWCTDKERQQRSNQIIIRTSGIDTQQGDILIWFALNLQLGIHVTSCDTEKNPTDLNSKKTKTLQRKNPTWPLEMHTVPNPDKKNKENSEHMNLETTEEASGLAVNKVQLTSRDFCFGNKTGDSEKYIL